MRSHTGSRPLPEGSGGNSCLDQKRAGIFCIKLALRAPSAVLVSMPWRDWIFQNFCLQMRPLPLQGDVIFLHFANPSRLRKAHVCAFGGRRLRRAYKGAESCLPSEHFLNSSPPRWDAGFCVTRQGFWESVKR